MLFLELQSKEFLKLKKEVIQSYLQQLSKEGLSAKTLARRLASIKSLYKLKHIDFKIDEEGTSIVRI